MWMGPGFNQALGLPFESLDAASGNPLPAERYRAMACARASYVYVEASGAAAAHADRLFESLCAHFQDARGGWRYSVDAQARPLDRRDLYTRLHRVRLRRVFPALAQRRGAQAHAGRGGNHRGPLQAADGLYEAAVASDWARAARPGIP